MRNKYKRKKTNVYTLIISTVLLMLLITISIGYSWWSDTLTVNGTITASKKVEIGHTEIISSGEGANDFTIPDLDSSVLTITNQYVEENIIHINYLVHASKGTPYTTNINFNFKNITDYTFLGGTSSYTVTGQTSTIDGSVRITIPTTLEPQATANINIAVPLKFNKFTESVDVTCTITYLVNNVPTDFIVLLHFTK